MVGTGGNPISVAPRARGRKGSAVGEGADQRPRGTATPNRSRWRSAAPASRFNACPSTLRCGAGRTSSSRSIAAADRRPAGRAAARAVGGRRALYGLGPPTPVGIERYPALPAFATRAFGSVREQDLGNSAQRTRRGVTVPVPAPNASRSGVAERAQHTRAGQVARQQGFRGHFGCVIKITTARSMPASIAYHSRRRQKPFRVAGGQLSPRAGTTLPIRSAVGGRPGVLRPRDRSTLGFLQGRSGDADETP